MIGVLRSRRSRLGPRARVKAIRDEAGFSDLRRIHRIGEYG